ncbi:MAG: Holliday junction resolvase RuvX [Chlamydiia bacterium]|jgi:putative Holliday junction resolvase
MRILGIDYGKKRIGLAISSTVASMALPLCTIQHKGPIPEAARLILEQVSRLKDIEEIIIGWPLYMDGTQSPLCGEVLELKKNLELFFKKPIHLVDERLTSRIAEESYRSVGLSRKERKDYLDQAAACGILETFLQRKKHF